MDYDKLSALFKKRDELKETQQRINDNYYTLALCCKSSMGGYLTTALEDSYKSIICAAINTKLLDIEYKIKEALKE